VYVISVLTFQDKEQQWESFRDGPQFGMHTWTTLQFFEANMHQLLETSRIYLALALKIQDGNIMSLLEVNYSNGILSQYLILDVIAKIQTIIETTLVLIEAISNGYSSIAKTMTYYDQRLPRQIVEKIRMKCYNFQKILGLPNISDLPLSTEERKVLAKIFQETVNIYSKKIATIAEFYDRYRIIYGKWKHGLTIRAGEQFGDLKPLNTAVLTVLDSKEEKDMPKGYFQAFSRSYPMNDHWYNVLGILKINQKLENEIRKTADELSEIISYTVQNHLMHAKNCGEGYLPVMELNEDSFSFWFPQMQLTPDEIETMTSIKEKISPNIHIIRTNLLPITIADAKIKKSIIEDTVTNVWITMDPQYGHKP
jgi:hypothetical protein